MVRLSLTLMITLILALPVVAQSDAIVRCAELLHVPEDQIIFAGDWTCDIATGSPAIPTCQEIDCEVSVLLGIGPTGVINTICPDVQEIFYNRAGVTSQTCVYSDGGYSMDVITNNNLYMIESYGDPLTVAQFFAGETDRTAFDDTNNELTNSQAGDTFPSIDLSACSGLDAVDDAQCIAELALDADDYHVCFAAIDVYACGAALMTQIDDPCAGQLGDDELSCRILFATETGIEASCELLPAEAQGACFVFAAVTSGDISLIERRYPPALTAT